jgi:hypothetical protein
MRAANSSGNVGASAEAAENSAKSATAALTMNVLEKRSPSDPNTG